MAVALATLESNVYTTIYNHLTSGTYSLITAGVVSSSSQVTPVYSDNTASKYGYPVIEIGDPIISDINDDRFGNVQKASITVPFLIVEDNAADAKTTADAVKNKINTGYNVFKLVGLHKPRGRSFIVDGGKTIINKNKKHYHYKRFSVNFDYVEQVDY